MRPRVAYLVGVDVGDTGEGGSFVEDRRDTLAGQWPTEPDPLVAPAGVAKMTGPGP